MALEEELQETKTSSEATQQSLKVSHQEVRLSFKAQRETANVHPHNK